MIALGVHYLTGYAVATDLARQAAGEKRPEWPPHPGRVFMALAAAHFETGSDPSERAALEWLEGTAPPALRVSDADERSPVRAYVPVNDKLKAKKGHDIYGRSRQDRAFPRVRPRHACVYLIWQEEPPLETRAALDGLCAKVTRVGHSISAAQMWLVPSGQEPEPNWVPTSCAETHMRVASRGTLSLLKTTVNAEAVGEYDALAEAIEDPAGKERAQLKRKRDHHFPGGRPESRRPQLVDWQGYTRATRNEDGAAVFDSPFSEDFVVLTKVEGSALGLETTVQLTGALRNAAMKAAGNDVPEWLSGHDASGRPSMRPHVAFFAIPYVGFKHADGHVLGLGMAIPRQFDLTRGATADEELRMVLGPLFFSPETGDERDIELWREGVWRWTLERERRERPPLSLERLSWTRPGRRWASVTPVVLHHYPRNREGDVERIVEEAFVSALLPQPEIVRVRSASAVTGAGHALSMPLFTEGGATLCRYQTHVVVQFAQPVRGPILVGRGRFRGYGLFRPLAEGEALPWAS